MTIDELNALATLTAGDEFPVWDSEESGESTKKITAQNMTTSVKALGSLVNASEMSNALAGKQNTLTFDTTPTTGSTNPVTSGGVADAIAQRTAEAVKHVGKTVTIPSGVSQMQQVQIDFSDLLPSGVEAILLSATIGDYALPYCDDTGAVKTWIYKWGRYSHILTVKNLTTVWNNIYTDLEVDIRQ